MHDALLLVRLSLKTSVLETPHGATAQSYTAQHLMCGKLHIVMCDSLVLHRWAATVCAVCIAIPCYHATEQTNGNRPGEGTTRPVCHPLHAAALMQEAGMLTTSVHQHRLVQSRYPSNGTLFLVNCAKASGQRNYTSLLSEECCCRSQSMQHGLW